MHDDADTKEGAHSARTRKRVALDDLRRPGTRVAVVRGPVYLPGGTKLHVEALGDDAASGDHDARDRRSARAERQLNRYFKSPADKEAAEAIIDHFRNDEPARKAILDALEVSRRGPADREMLKRVRESTEGDVAAREALNRLSGRLRDPLVREAMQMAADKPEIADLLRRLGALPPADYAAAIDAISELADIFLASPRPRGPFGRASRIVRIVKAAWARRD